MSIKISKNDVLWSYLSLFLFNGMNLILLPFILYYLSADEVGLWYTFTAIAGLVIILDFGFMTSLARNVTFIWAGAESIEVTGFKINKNIEQIPNYSLFAKLFATTKFIYFSLGLLILILLLFVGTPYIYSVSNNSLGAQETIIAWLIYSSAVYFNMRYAYWNPILKGIGAIKKSQQLLIITKLSQLLFTIIALIIGLGLIGVSAAYLLSIIINRMLANTMFYSYQNNKEIVRPLLKEKIDKIEKYNIFKTLLPNVYRQGLISISNYLNLRFPILLSSAYLGLQITSSLGLVLQVLSLITVIANTFFNTYLPQFSAYRVKNDYNSLKATFKKAIVLNNVIIFVSFALFLLVGEFILEIINSNVNLLPIPITLTIMLFLFLYNTHSIFATLLSTSNILPHYKSFIISAVVGVFLQLILLNLLEPSIWYLLVPVILIQMLYNNWKWPLESNKEIRKNAPSKSEVKL